MDCSEDGPCGKHEVVTSLLGSVAYCVHCGHGGCEEESDYRCQRHTQENMVYLATVNTPGYLPENDHPSTFESALEAWEYLLAEREHGEDDTYDESSPSGYSETHAFLARVVAALSMQSEAEIARCGLNDDGTGVVYGGTPGYEGDHDLGLAYVVSLTEGKSEDDE